MALKRLARYPVGAQVTVHYNPVAPAEAILETGPHQKFAQYVLVGGVMVLAGVAVLAIRRRFVRASSCLRQKAREADEDALSAGRRDAPEKPTTANPGVERPSDD